jgi:hypothetical protein
MEQTVAKHRRADEDATLAVVRYEALVRALYLHKPGQRSGLCVVCGIAWPCVEIWLALGIRSMLEHGSE